MTPKQAAIGAAIVTACTTFFMVVVVLSAPSPEPSEIVCEVFDLSTADGKRWKGWHPMPQGHRPAIIRRAERGEVELMVPVETLDCIERHPDNRNFGTVVNTHKMEWWRWVDRKAKKPERAPDRG